MGIPRLRDTDHSGKFGPRVAAGSAGRAPAPIGKISCERASRSGFQEARIIGQARSLTQSQSGADIRRFALHSTRGTAGFVGHPQNDSPFRRIPQIQSRFHR